MTTCHCGCSYCCEGEKYWAVWYRKEFFGTVSTMKGELSVEDLIFDWCERNRIKPITDDWLLCPVESLERSL